MPGTTRGETGWYQNGDLCYYFDIEEGSGDGMGEFVLAKEPISELAWSRLAIYQPIKEAASLLGDFVHVLRPLVDPALVGEVLLQYLRGRFPQLLLPRHLRPNVRTRHFALSPAARRSSPTAQAVRAVRTGRPRPSRR